MADQPVTKEKLINADKDVQVIEDFIKKSKDETVTTRFGDQIMTLKGLEEEVKKSGGYFKRYTTLAAANADIANIPVNSVVKVTDVVDGGDYEKATAGATSLTKSPYDPFAQSKNYSDNLKSLSDAEDVNVNGRISRLLVAIEQIVTSIIDVSNDVDSLNASQSLALSNAVNGLKVELATNITNAVSVPNTENFNINVRLSRLLVSIQQIAQVISDLKSETDGEFLAVNSLIASNNTSNNNSISSLSIEASDINKRISYLLMGLQQLTAAISTNSDDIDALASSTTANTLVNSKASLGMNMALQTLTMELHKLDDFNPEFAGANTTVVSENVTFFPIPSSVIRIDVETSSSLPTAKGTVILANIAINVDGQVLQSKATVEVQGSSSAGFPKKNWTFGFFSDDARENAIKVKLGHMMPHEELVWKANLVDNTQSRNIAVNRLYDQFQMSRSGFPKREPDFVNMVGGVGLAYAPTGAIGHVDGFPSVVYINGVFYGLGTLNIGKKRENYNLDKNKATHIQLEPQGNVNYVAMPSSPTNTDSGLEIRRPSKWGLEAQGYYERLVAWMAKSRADMEADGIDNYFNRANLMDYIILVQVCDLWDHMGKNAELTTWDGQVWNFLPYDCDTVFGLWWTGTIMDLATSTAWRPPENLLISINGTTGANGFFSKCRRIYGADIDARYAELRNRGIISVDNITNICLEIIRKFPSELLKAEDAKWKTDSNSNYGGLVQSSSIHQINNWLSVHIPVVDAYFNYTA